MRINPLSCCLPLLLLATACHNGSSSVEAPPKKEPPQEPRPLPWVSNATVGGLYVDHSLTDEELDALLEERRSEHVSVLELDSRMSYYLSDEEYSDEVKFLDHVAEMAHAKGMRAVIYHPALEVLTQNGLNAPHTMYKDHPDWVQIGISGAPNVFYGNLEHWVEPDAESAWMSPNSGYREYLLRRIGQLAKTELDGVWIDVPAYVETGSTWADIGPGAAEAFRQWSISTGEAPEPGYALPLATDLEDPVFKAWLRWRHHNLADFIEDIRVTAVAVNPEFLVAIETFPVDSMDATLVGLDGSYLRNGQNLIRVWEIDSVSNSTAMMWSNAEDFSSKIAMNKWSLAMERGNPTWVFSYGYQPIDAGLVMGAAVATGAVPFEAQTPQMLTSVGKEFRTRWFGYLRERADAVWAAGRYASVAVWYSSATRDYFDFPVGGYWGMYINTVPPADSPDWWTDHPDDSAAVKPHLGGWRGAAFALTRLGIPFTVVSEPGNPAPTLGQVQVLWLPSVVAMSEASAELVRQFVSDGGVVLATGHAPATMDETGRTRRLSALADVFRFADAQPGARMQKFGKGLAIYRPDVPANQMLSVGADPAQAATTLSAMEQLLRLHAPDVVRFGSLPGVHVEVARPSEDKHNLYVLNFTGLQQPIVPNPVNLRIQYRPPTGWGVAEAHASTPDTAGYTGPLHVEPYGGALYTMTTPVDQFAMVELTLEPINPQPHPPYTRPSFANEAWEEAAQSGLAFILEKMRPNDLPEPLRFGVFTNLSNDWGNVDIYAHGHSVTAEHMGLLLRTTACMGDVESYRQALRYVAEVMQSPGYSVINWAIDRNTHRPMVTPGWDSWINANAPLHDLRIARGLLFGARLGITEAEALGHSLLKGLYWTSVTDRARDTEPQFSAYPGGLLGSAFNWFETDDPHLVPPAVPTGLGHLMADPIPVNYQDLYTVALGAAHDPRWQGVLESATDLLLDSEIDQSGLFYNGLRPDGTFTGDFQNQGLPQGSHLKTIQVLRTALHLARGSTLAHLDASRRARAEAAAARSLAFFAGFYANAGRIPEYLTVAGRDVPNCNVDPGESLCLTPGTNNLMEGEARIYALLARLALWQGDLSFAKEIIEQEILTDRISDKHDPRYGVIGASTTTANDADAWNILESVLTLCQAAGGLDGPGNLVP